MFDALTFAAIADELTDKIVRGRVQRVQHVDQLTIALEIYGRGNRNWLTMSADSQNARIVVTPDRPQVDSDIVTPMLLLLRKHVRGARILSVNQPRYERILNITVAQARYEEDEDEAVELEIHDLTIEIMGRHSNLILVDEEGRIRDSVKRVTPSMSRVRPIQPGNPYTPPPPQEKLDPSLVGPSDLLEIAAESSNRLDRWLVSSMLGISPLIAREIMHRSDLPDDLRPANLSVSQCESILRQVSMLFRPLIDGNWQPRSYQYDGGATFASISLHHLEEQPGVVVVQHDNVLEAIADSIQLGEPRRAVEDRHAPRRKRLIAEIKGAQTLFERRRTALERQLAGHANPDGLRVKGEMIYAYIWMIEPGMTTLDTPDGLKIELDPEMSPAENAQEYFERYKKARSAAEKIPGRIGATNDQLAYLAQLKFSAEQADSYDEIESVRLEWQAFADSTPGVGGSAKPGGSKPAASARKPRRLELESGALVWIGRTGHQNDTVTFDIGLPDDLWLHAREMPGAHVILRSTPGTDAGDGDINIAAALAAYHSAGRQAPRVPIDVTERRHVRKIRGAGPGMVTYRNEYTIGVVPKSESELGLEIP